MKVGDLVQVLPARMGFYIITRRICAASSSWVSSEDRGHYWQLEPVCEDIFGNYGPMSEEYIEVVSECR